jgi:exoribonuclease R
MIITALTCLVGGVVIGMTIKQERLSSQYQKTYQEVDEQIRKDLVYYKNLTESLKQDLHWEKTKNEKRNT